MPRGKRYSEADRAAALAYYEACGSQRRTALNCGIPETTIRDWVKGTAMNEDTHELARVKKQELSERIEHLAHLLIDQAPGKISDATLQQTITSLGIAIDKLQLLRNKPTVITDDASLTDHDRAQRIAALLDQAGERRDRPSVVGDVHSNPPATPGPAGT